MKRSKKGIEIRIDQNIASVGVRAIENTWKDLNLDMNRGCRRPLHESNYFNSGRTRLSKRESATFLSALCFFFLSSLAFRIEFASLSAEFLLNLDHVKGFFIQY